MAKDNFWKNPKVRKALLMLADTDYNNRNPADDLTTGELFKSNKTKNMLKVAGVKYPSQLDIDAVRRANNEWWNPFDDNTGYQWIYANFANSFTTMDSFRNRLIGLTKAYPELNEIVFNDDGSVNQANVDRISKVAYAKLGTDSPLDFFKNSPKYYYVRPDMSEDEAGFRGEAFEEYFGDTPEYLNDGLNYSGSLLALDERAGKEYKAKQQKQQQLQNMIKAAKAGSLASNSNANGSSNIEATIGGDPVNVLPSYVQASMNPEKSDEEKIEEKLFKRRAEDEEWGQRLEDLINKRFDESKKGTDWWWL